MRGSVPAPKPAPSAFLQLSGFVPFRLNRLATAVSEYLAVIYRERFGLEVPEWRILVTIGLQRDCTAQQVAASTRMHKTRVSRAVAALRRRGLIGRAPSTRDARALHLALTPAGRRLYAALVPLALAREQALLARLSARDRAGLLRGLAQLEVALGLGGE
jgi:DNA-binding MarR family transcriptional regulator